MIFISEAEPLDVTEILQDGDGFGWRLPAPFHKSHELHPISWVATTKTRQMKKITKSQGEHRERTLIIPS